MFSFGNISHPLSCTKLDYLISDIIYIKSEPQYCETNCDFGDVSDSWESRDVKTNGTELEKLYHCSDYKAHYNDESHLTYHLKYECIVEAQHNVHISPNRSKMLQTHVFSKLDGPARLGRKYCRGCYDKKQRGKIIVFKVLENCFWLFKFLEVLKMIDNSLSHSRTLTNKQ